MTEDPGNTTFKAIPEKDGDDMASPHKDPASDAKDGQEEERSDQDHNNSLDWLGFGKPEPKIEDIATPSGPKPISKSDMDMLPEKYRGMNQRMHQSPSKHVFETNDASEESKERSPSTDKQDRPPSTTFSRNTPYRRAAANPELDESSVHDNPDPKLVERASRLRRQHSKDSRFSFAANQGNARSGAAQAPSGASKPHKSVAPHKSSIQKGVVNPVQNSRTSPDHHPQSRPEPAHLKQDRGPQKVPSLSPPNGLSSKTNLLNKKGQQNQQQTKPPYNRPFNPSSSSRDNKSNRTVTDHGHEGCQDVYCQVLREWRHRKRALRDGDAEVQKIVHDREERLRLAEIERNRTYLEANPSLSSQRRYLFDPDRVGSDRRAPNPDSKRSFESQETTQLLQQKVKISKSPQPNSKQVPQPSPSKIKQPSYRLPSKIDEGTIKVRDEMDHTPLNNRRKKRSKEPRKVSTHTNSSASPERLKNPSKLTKMQVTRYDRATSPLGHSAPGSRRREGTGIPLIAQTLTPLAITPTKPTIAPKSDSRKGSQAVSEKEPEEERSETASLDSEDRVAERDELYAHLWENLVTIEKLKGVKMAVEGPLTRNKEHNKMARKVGKLGLEDEFWVQGNQALLDRHRKLARVLTDQANNMPKLAKKVVAKDLMLKLDQFVQTNYKPVLFSPDVPDPS